MSVSVETFASLSEASSAIRDGAQYLGGGTIVVADANYGAQDFTRIVRTTDASLRVIRNEGNELRIGAGATMTQVMQSAEAGFLASAARSVAGPAVRNMATVGGNLFARPPFGDFGVALLALDARIAMSDGQVLPAEDFFARRETLKGLVSSILVPRPGPRAFRYRKVARTKPKGASVLSIAVHLPGAGRMSGARIAFGAMGPTPLRAKSSEAALEGARLDPNGILPAILNCLDGLDPQDDALSSAWYRREVAPVHLRRVLLGEES